MKNLILFLFLACSLACTAQNNTVYGAGVGYFAGPPTVDPGARGGKVGIDTVSGYWYEYFIPGGWRLAGDRVQTISGLLPPAYTPGKGQSRLVINFDNELYHYTGAAWVHINAGQTYTAGTGISIAGNVITNTGDTDATNDLTTATTFAGDVAGLFNNLQIPALTITNADIANATIAAAKLVNSGATAGTYGSATQVPVVTVNAQGVVTSITLVTVSGGGGTPGGSAGAIQYNNAGSFGGGPYWDATNSRIGIGTSSPTVTLDIPNNSTTTPQLRTGSLEFQSYSVNNAWFGDNMYFNGTSFARRNAGFAGLFYFAGSEGQFRFYDTGAAGSTAAFQANLKVDYTGKFGVGASISNAAGTYTGAKFYVDNNGLSGFNTTAQTAQADINGATGYNQFRERTSFTPSGTADPLGNIGDHAWDATYEYRKTASGWKRAALSTF